MCGVTARTLNGGIQYEGVAFFLNDFNCRVLKQKIQGIIVSKCFQKCLIVNDIKFFHCSIFIIFNGTEF